MSAPRGPLPVTGAWLPGQPAGPRLFLRIAEDRPLRLEGGGEVRSVDLAYETWGTLDAQAGNALLICHAWTGDSHVSATPGHGSSGPGWWEGMVGPGCWIDTDRFFVVCANVLGGCQGTTGPASPHPSDGRPYALRFPVVTVRDMVRTQRQLADHLGVERWASVIGGSMGGMQALEWGIMYPDRVRSLIPIATCVAHTAQQVALGHVGREAIRSDERWRNGDYYDANPGDGPHRGLAVARMLAQITFRTDLVYTNRFGRGWADLPPEGSSDGFGLWQRFEVERYLDYHGEKLVRRFDANSYLVISKALDLHDVGRGRGGLARAMARIAVPTLSVGVSSDILYPTYQQREIVDLIAASGGDARYVEIDSPNGHDAFLIEDDQVGAALHDFLIDVEKSA